MKQKQALLLIHGIGEQRPMDTLRGFVHTVWTTDEAVQHEHAVSGVFSKPDDLSGSYELRRLTTTKASNDVRTDFYEFYWAHLMEGTSLNHVASWARCLLFRWPWNLPRTLRGAWFLLVLGLCFVAWCVFQTIVSEEHSMFPKWLTGGMGALAIYGIVPLINSFIGDAARYLHPAPANIQRRQEIRMKGVEILKKLHDCGEYDRIIVVGHSLGSVIGYDILTYAWPLYSRTTGIEKELPILARLEDAVARNSLSAVEYQVQQRELLRELQAYGCPWLVTDFVTLGSPLTHAEILLAHGIADLKSKQAERELPTCPPMLEEKQEKNEVKKKFSYLEKKDKVTDEKHVTLHHAAVFGPTRWSNLYFPSQWIFLGDLIGGPLSPGFGAGVYDQEVHTSQRRGFLSHTLYWSLREATTTTKAHIEKLRAAVNLLDREPRGKPIASPGGTLHETRS